jgi:UDP-N-acetylmuramate dehydrogenase
MGAPDLTNGSSGLRVDTTGCSVDDLVYCGAVQVAADACESWDGIVQRAVTEGWLGVEALSGLPGSIADVTRANVSAYGQSVSDAVVSVRTWDRHLDRQRTFAALECDFGPGSSRFTEHLPDGTLRYDVREVTILLKQGDLTTPIRDEELASRLGIASGGRVPLARVRHAVLGG